MNENKKEKNIVELKVKLQHPNQKFQLGRHAIGIEFKKYDLNEAEKKELSGAGPQHWLEIKK